MSSIFENFFLLLETVGCGLYASRMNNTENTEATINYTERTGQYQRVGVLAVDEEAAIICADTEYGNDWFQMDKTSDGWEFVYDFYR